MKVFTDLKTRALGDILIAVTDGLKDMPEALGAVYPATTLQSCFVHLKTELFYPRNCQAITVEQFIQIVDSYIRWYNEKRIKISLGPLSPREYRESLGITA